MISAITDLNDLSGGKASPLYPRVFSAFNTRFSPFDGVYKQVNDSGETTALFSCADSHCTFVFSSNADKDELLSFFKFGKIVSVTSCEKSDIPKGFNCEAFELMKLFITQKSANAEMLGQNDGAALYKKLFSSFGEYFGFSDFSRFYLAIAPKIAKNEAALFYICDSEKPVSFAAASNICENSAIISGVFTAEGYRNKKYASLSVSALGHELKRRNIDNIFLWCDAATAGFYERLGYKQVSKIFIGRLN